MKMISNLLGLSTPKPPEPSIPEPPPTIDQARMAAESRDQMLKRKGRRSTILNGPGGVSSTNGEQKTTLIGN